MGLKDQPGVCPAAGPTAGFSGPAGSCPAQRCGSGRAGSPAVLQWAANVTWLPVLTSVCCRLEAAWGRRHPIWTRNASSRGSSENLSSYLTPEPLHNLQRGPPEGRVWADCEAGQGKTDPDSDLAGQQDPRPGHFQKGKNTGEKKQPQGCPR